MHKLSFLFFTFLFFISCTDDELNTNELSDTTLATALESREIVIDNVIACAALNENNDLISVFLFPREGVTNIQYFETQNSTVGRKMGNYFF